MFNRIFSTLARVITPAPAAYVAPLMPAKAKINSVGSSVVNAAHKRANRLYAHQTGGEGLVNAVTLITEALEVAGRNGGFYTGLVQVADGSYINFSIIVIYPRMSCDIQIDGIHYTHAAAFEALARLL